jgi:hypothetical protein
VSAAQGIFSFFKKNEKEFILVARVEQDLDTLAAGVCPLRKIFLILNHFFL